MHNHLNLRGKLIAVSIISVIVALGLSTYINTELAHRAFLQRFQEDVATLAKELAAGFGGSMELDSWQTLTQKIHQIKEARPEIQYLQIFTKLAHNEWLLVAPEEEPPVTRLGRNEVASLARGRTLVELQAGKDEHLWKATTPIRTDRRIIGALQLVISWEAAREDEAKERQQTLLMLAATVLLVSTTLGIFVQRAVYRPITRLVEAMQRAQTGTLDIEVQPRGRDELAQLTRHFNNMLVTIRQSTAEKEALLAQIRRFNEELQAKVTEATETLAQRNQELQRVNEALFHSQRQLAQWERLAGMVYQSAAIAHEIGTPLHSIAGYIHLLLSDAQLPDNARRQLQIIESQLDRVAETLRTMLASTDQPTPQRQPLDLNTLLTELLHVTSPGMSLRDVKVHVHLQRDLPLVFADGNQLQQVFLNLITNALDAMPTGGELYIETALAEAGGPEPPGNRAPRSVTVH
ncbi:MAG: HAMP domain-containing protein, partial [candidate division KSB1 bacterium]|nr:HAMP domain-containing protein [candidate division KSB1 bacterium]